jgi:hypothetical protein
LIKAGYASSVPEAMTLDARTVIQAINYENFLGDYEACYIELNMPKE